MTALGLSGHFFVNQFNAEIVIGFQQHFKFDFKST